MPGATNDGHVRIDVEHVDGVVALRVSGELDLHAEPTLRAAIEGLAVGRDSVVEVDLSGVTFIDSTGLRCLVLCASRVQQLVLVDPTPHVEKVLAVGGLGDVFAVRHDAPALRQDATPEA